MLSPILALICLSATLRAQAGSRLPEAPEPHAAHPKPRELPREFVLPGKPGLGEEGPVDVAPMQARIWALYADPGEHTPELTAAQKMQFWLHEEVRLSAPLPELFAAGYGQLTGTPAYGTDSGAFGERLGAAFIRDATMRFFVSSLMPTITGEDPRYFRRANGRWQGRAAWAAEQAILLPRPDGRRVANLSDVVGHLAASLLTLAYYPDPSANLGVVMQTWGTSIAGTAGNNLFLEFWPDVVNKVIHRKQWRINHPP